MNSANSAKKRSVSITKERSTLLLLKDMNARMFVVMCARVRGQIVDAAFWPGIGTDGRLIYAPVKSQQDRTTNAMHILPKFRHFMCLIRSDQFKQVNIYA